MVRSSIFVVTLGTIEWMPSYSLEVAAVLAVLIKRPANYGLRLGMNSLSKGNNGAVQDQELRCASTQRTLLLCWSCRDGIHKNHGRDGSFPWRFLAFGALIPVFHIDSVSLHRNHDSYKIELEQFPSSSTYHDLHRHGLGMPTRYIPTSTRLYLVLAPPLLAITYIALNNPNARMWLERAAELIPLPWDWVPRSSRITEHVAKSDTQDVTDNKEGRALSKSSTYSQAFEGLPWAGKSSQGATSEEVREASRVLLEKLKEAETESRTRDDESSRSATSEEIRQVSWEIMEMAEAEAKLGACGASAPRELVPDAEPAEEFDEYYEDALDRESVEAWLAEVEAGHEVLWEAGESPYSTNVGAEDLDGLE